MENVSKSQSIQLSLCNDQSDIKKTKYYWTIYFHPIRDFHKKCVHYLMQHLTFGPVGY